MNSLTIATVFVAISSAFASVPSFITPCSLKDQSCLAKQATSTLKSILNGNKAFDVPKLNPLLLPLIDLKGAALSLQLKNLNVFGIENGEITSVKIDPVKRTGEAILHVDQAELIGEYALAGKILVITLDGHGNSNITAVGGDYIWSFSYDLEDKNGQKYAKINKDNTVYKIKRVYFQFNDLFKEDAALTKSTNQILNDEWEAVLEDLGSGIAAAIGDVFKLITNGFFSRIPFNEITKP